jgi:serine/threonine-protein kinase
VTALTGALLGGRYRRESRLAAGGMGEVWRAYDDVLGRPVAVKVLRPEYAADVTFCERLRAEARTVAALSHPGIAQVYDFGQATTGSGLSSSTVPYLVMELVPGEPLSTVIAREGALAADRAASIVGQAAAALYAAHTAGVVHCDVKPANLLVTPSGTVKVTDFGIARAANAVPMAGAGPLMGTPHYLAPEQIASRSPATPLSDVYALGIVLYECLAGRYPFPAGNPAAVAPASRHDEPPPLPAHVPPAVASLALRMLARNPADRPPSAGDVARQLAGLRTGPATQGRQPAVAAPPTVPLTDPAPTTRLNAGSIAQDTAVLEPAVAEPITRLRRRRSRPAVTRTRAATVLTGLVGLAALLAWLFTAGLGSGTTRVPLVEGKPVEQAVAELQKYGYRAEISQRADPTIPAGVVITQQPEPGARYPTDQNVRLITSSGPSQIIDPGREDGENQHGQDQDGLNGQGKSGKDKSDRPGRHGNG